jgi:hypothetical protein
LDKLAVKELIDKLREESEEGVGSHSTAWVSAFLASDEEPQFRGGILGSPKPKTSPVMRALVRRGVAALPELIDHLDDKRATKLVIADTFGLGNMWYSDEYAPRSRDPSKRPPWVNTGLKKFEGFDKAGRFEKRYTVRVGDLCFIAVGQIVNRRLSVVRYQPTACMVINSPVQTPTLAAAVKRDWAGLTVEQHKQSLSQDALSKYPYATASAIVRLLFYYPQEGEALALKLLARPLYDDDALWDFIRKRLAKEDNPARWKTMIEEFRQAHGQAAADALPFRLHWIYWMTDLERNKEFLAGKERASKILALFYPGYDPHSPSFINAAAPAEQADLIDSLTKCRSEKVDQAVYRVFQSAAHMKAATEDGRLWLDGLSVVCMSRLVGKGHDEEF